MDTLGEIEARRARGDIGPYRRIVVETTGLADPAPILHTIMADPAVAYAHRLAGVIATVDAVNGAATLDAHVEAVKQAAVADRILLTKVDLVAETEAAPLRRRLRAHNPGTPIVDIIDGQIEPAEIFGAGLYDPDGKVADVRRWLNAEAHAVAQGRGRHDHRHDVNRHDDRSAAHCVTIETPVRWEDFSHWLDLLAAMRGEEMLRVKGIVAIAEHPGRPMVVHGVQHVFHPPVQLDAWPSEDHRTRLVFITRDLPRALIESSLAKFGRVERDHIGTV